MDRASTPAPAGEEAADSGPPPNRRRVQALTRRLDRLTASYRQAEQRIIELDHELRDRTDDNGRLRAEVDRLTEAVELLGARLAAFGDLTPERLRQQAAELDREAAARLADADERARLLIADAEQQTEQARQRRVRLLGAVQEEAELLRRATRAELAEQAAAADERNAATRRSMIDQVDRQCSRMLAEAATLARELLQLADPEQARTEAHEQAWELVRTARREAEKILAEAATEAGEILAEAATEAEEILAEAREKADRGPVVTRRQGGSIAPGPAHRATQGGDDGHPGSADRPEPRLAQPPASAGPPLPVPTGSTDQEPPVFVRALDLLRPAPWKRDAATDDPDVPVRRDPAGWPIMPDVPHFVIVLRGYDRSEVDGYVQWAKRCDQSSSGARTWRPAVFRTSVRGYDQAQVDTYVRQVEAVLRGRESRRRKGGEG
ncbi:MULTISPECIES: DivIVA domain-containing protein [unclassified Micromonospora]|uniref:DivIVA domain-containing protein n=1 Tax=unclassified Micromonospora TaxID=2617518 RepID=UPI00362E3FB4